MTGPLCPSSWASGAGTSVDIDAAAGVGSAGSDRRSCRATAPPAIPAPTMSLTTNGRTWRHRLRRTGASRGSVGRRGHGRGRRRLRRRRAHPLAPRPLDVLRLPLVRLTICLAGRRALLQERRRRGRLRQLHGFVGLSLARRHLAVARLAGAREPAGSGRPWREEIAARPRSTAAAPRSAKRARGRSPPGTPGR